MISLEGIHVYLDNQHCRKCEGQHELTIGAPTQVHAGRLNCAGCTRFVGWLPKSTANYVAEMVKEHGPDGVIVCKS
jgi:hypothetical protein